MRFVLIAIYLILIMPITGSWWAEGSNILLDPTQVCKNKNKKSRRLSGKLADICRNETSLLKEITKGINMGFRECENQFKNNQWNCSTLKRSMRRILMKDTRETAFVHAITAAGITYAVTKACTMGDLVECSCDKSHGRRYLHNQNNNKNNVNKLMASNNLNDNNLISLNQNNNYNSFVSNINNNNKKNDKQTILKTLKKQKKVPKQLLNPEGSWEWGGCDDNVNFGFKKSKEFLDSRLKKKSDIKTLIRLHNNDAGRLAVKQFMRLECKCHGLSGSCTMRTCWMKMPQFSDVGARLKEHFDGATKVIAKNDGHSFMPEGPTIKPPTRRDLVYTEESPDFCKPNHKTGSLGTHGRECNITSNGIDGCNLLCCERGQSRKLTKVKRNCKCRFKWCCEVTCSTCIEDKEIYTCK